MNRADACHYVIIFGLIYLGLNLYNLINMTQELLQLRGVEIDLGGFFISYFTQLIGLIFTASLIVLAHKLRESPNFKP